MLCARGAAQDPGGTASRWIAGAVGGGPEALALDTVSWGHWYAPPRSNRGGAYHVAGVKILEHLGLPAKAPEVAKAEEEPQGELWPTGPPEERERPGWEPEDEDQRWTGGEAGA